MLLVGAPSRLSALLRLRRSLLHQPDRCEDVERELQELRLPVLHHRLAEVRGCEIAEVGDGLLGVLDGVLVVEAVTDEGLREERQEQESAAKEGERVLADETHLSSGPGR